MSVDLNAIKVGDELTVRMKVRELGMGAPPDSIWCDGFGPNSYVRVVPARIVEHIPAPPKPLEAGERVRPKGVFYGKQVGKLHSINGPWAWVEWDGGGCPLTYNLAELERV